MGRHLKAGELAVDQIDGRIQFTYRRGQYERRTVVGFSQAGELAGQSVPFTFELAPKAQWRLCVDIMPLENLDQVARPLDCNAAWFGQPLAPGSPRSTGFPVEESPSDINPWLAGAPKLVTDDEVLQEAYDQALVDLGALLMDDGSGRSILAAGLPWFMAIFGRDSLISAYQTLLLGPRLAQDTLAILARYQATAVNDFRDAQPGKIPHEIRRGELSVLDQMPHSRYYGTADATPLFLVLLSEVYRWTGDLEFIKTLLPAARWALEWIDRYGDLDGDGFVEYERRTQHGLRNQGWKDSNDSIVFADGQLASGPIALCEVQGYVYDAKLRLAELLTLTGDEAGGAALRKAAEDLRRRFEDAFWMPEYGFYALALDGRKRRVDSIVSNAGHCLWSGIVAPERAAQIAERLTAPDMFTGWGIRTMSSEMRAYNPISYHNGSVWPHDTCLAAAGLARYGFDREAGTILRGLIDATDHLPRHRLPEVFGGFARRRRGFPPAYPTANAPQAWATGAVVLAVRLLLGAEPAGADLARRPIPDASVLRLEGVAYRGRSLTLANP